MVGPLSTEIGTAVDLRKACSGAFPDHDSGKRSCQSVRRIFLTFEPRFWEQVFLSPRVRTRPMDCDSLCDLDS